MTRAALLLVTLALGACRLQTEPLSPTEIYQRVAASSVLVRTPGGTGSGTVILNRPHALVVLTARHVVHKARSISIQVAEDDQIDTGRMLSARATVLLSDAQHDLALLLAEPTLDLPALPVARSEPTLYEPLYIVAAPLGHAGTAAPGLLSAKARRYRDVSVWEITGFIFFGSSGGTVTNARGELVAIPVVVALFGKLPISQLGYVVPLPAIRAFLARTMFRRAVLGGAT